MNVCKYPGCGYSTIRTDNFFRHEAIHLKEKVTCQCGMELSPAALDRRKKNSCVLTIKSSVKIYAQIQGTTTAKVQATVQICTKEDGGLQIQHGPIKINGEKFALVPQSFLDSINITNNNNVEEDQPRDIVDHTQNDANEIGDSLDNNHSKFDNFEENSDDFAAFIVEEIYDST